MSSVETVTVLFTDLVGSTGLAVRVGPAAAEELRREHFRVLREAINQTGGREVKNVGDGLMVVFSSCSEAVACSVGMQQRLEQRNRRADEQLAVRIGVSTGEADAEDDDYFGSPVVEASRLCNAAGGGQILCGELVRLMARQGHDFRPVGALELKGLSEPFPAHEIGWEPLSARPEAVPLSSRLREVPPVGYVGHRAERDRLSRLLDEARRRCRRVALISGEPGIGKTRLATQLAVDAHGEGAIVLYGRCDEEQVAPYGPWAEALRHYVRTGPEEVLRSHAERQGGELARVVPEIGVRIAGYPGVRETDPETERYLLFGAVMSLLEEATRHEPLVLILDDLHWADKPSLSLLRHLVTHGAEMRVLVLGTYRDSDLDEGAALADLLADLHREAEVSRVALRGLEAGDVVAIMEAAAGHELDETGRNVAAAIVRETEGNPFFVGELLRHLVESGAMVQGTDGRFSLEGEIEDLGLPQSVREVVGRRVARLSEPSRRALGIAAVIGRDFDVDLLAAVLDIGEDELLDLLDEAAAASVINESGDVFGRFTFAHALVNHTLYEDLGRTRRVRLHRRIAEALEELCAGDPGARVTELARHWALAATPDEAAKAAEYARQAGQRALAELAPDEALRWFGQAAELQPSDAERAERFEVLLGLGEAQRLLANPAFRDTLLQASKLAEELGDADRAARAALANNRGWGTFGQVDEERIAALERAVELDGRRNAARCAHLIGRQAAELQYDPDHERRWALAEEALALARAAGDERTLAHVLFDTLYATLARNDVMFERTACEELFELVRRLDDPALEVMAAFYETFIRVIEGDLERARAAIARARAIASDLAQPVLLWYVAYIESCLRLLEGDLGASERLAEEALAIGSSAGLQDAYMVFGATISVIRRAQDRGPELVELTEQVVTANPRMPAWRAALGPLYIAAGREDEAAAILAEAAHGDFAMPYDSSRGTGLVFLAESAFELGNRHAAGVLYAKLEPVADEIVWNGASTLGAVRTYLGMLAGTMGRHDLADRHFVASIDLQEGAGIRLWTAYARGRWAEVLAARGESNRAQEQAERALEAAREGGYAEVERRARELLEAAVHTS
jgi:class 3 adenylate cyclase/tetratricopeptide (TPR) repeat protein